MHRPSFLLALCLLAPPVLATGTQASARPAVTDGHAAAGRLDHQLAQSKAEVAKLQQGVARQESQSRESAARLQQQDQTIAELKRQLQALKAEPASAPASH
jgi:septal ring factor EnvC (AmiA/AmiB activator)